MTEKTNNDKTTTQKTTPDDVISFKIPRNTKLQQISSLWDSNNSNIDTEHIHLTENKEKQVQDSSTNIETRHNNLNPENTFITRQITRQITQQPALFNQQKKISRLSVFHNEQYFQSTDTLNSNKERISNLETHPIVIKIGVIIPRDGIRSVDAVTGIDLSFFVKLTWNDIRFINKFVTANDWSNLWQPEIGVPNAIEIEETMNTTQMLDIRKGTFEKNVVYRAKIGGFHDLWLFPLDSHVIKIQITASKYMETTDKLIFKIDEQIHGNQTNFLAHLPDWAIEVPEV